MTNDARLVLDTLRSAAVAGATLLNYTPMESSRRDGDAWVCRVGKNEVRARTISGMFKGAFRPLAA